MGGNKDMWLALADPMMAQLTGNDWAEEHKREINTSAAAAAAIAALIFSGGSAAPALAGAAGAGEAAAAGAAGTALTGAEVAAMYGGGTALSASEIAAMYGAGAAGTTGAEAAALDAYMMGAAGGTESGLLSAGPTAAVADPYMAGAAGGAGQGTLPALEGFGGGTASLFGPEALQGTAYGGATGGTASLFGPEAGFASSMLGNGAAQPTMGQIAAGANANAAVGPSAWDRIGKGLKAYAKYQAIAAPMTGMLAPPQQPQTPQPRPLSMGQAKSQQGPTDWAQYFGPGLSDDEIRKRQLMMMQYGYGAH